MMQITPRDRKLLSFCQERMRVSGRAPTFQAMRLRLGLPSEDHAKKAFTDLVEHLTHIQISSLSSIAAIERGDS